MTRKPLTPNEVREALANSSSNGLGSTLPHALPIKRGKPTAKELEIERAREQDREQGAAADFGDGASRKLPVRYDE